MYEHEETATDACDEQHGGSALEPLRSWSIASWLYALLEGKLSTLAGP